MKTSIIEKIIHTLYIIDRDMPDLGVNIGIQREFGNIKPPQCAWKFKYKDKFYSNTFLNNFKTYSDKGLPTKSTTYYALLKKFKSFNYVEVPGVSYEEVYIRALGNYYNEEVIKDFYNRVKVENTVFVPDFLAEKINNDLVLYKKNGLNLINK